MAKLNKEQLKKLYDYGGTLSPKDWAIMIDNMGSGVEYDNSGTIVTTTYQKAKALYESDQMIPGVYYEFPYNTRFDLSYKDNDSTLIKILTQSATLKVYINRQGELKVLGIENRNDAIVGFESDYSFKFKQVNFTVTDTQLDYNYETDEEYENTITEGIIEIIKYQTCDFEFNLNIPEELKTYCNDNNISIVKEDYSLKLTGNMAYVYIHNVDYGNQLIIVSESSNKFHMKFNDMDDIDLIEISSIKTPPGFLYNVKYAYYKHSHLLNGMINGLELIINANYISNNYDMLTIPMHIYGGDVNNCTFKSDIDDRYIEIYDLYATDVNITLEMNEEHTYDDTLYYLDANLYDRSGQSVTLTSESNYDDM